MGLRFRLGLVPAERWLPKVGVGLTLVAFSNERQGLPGLSEVVAQRGPEEPTESWAGGNVDLGGCQRRFPPVFDVASNFSDSVRLPAVGPSG